MRQRSEVIVDMVVAYDADSLLWGLTKIRYWCLIFRTLRFDDASLYTRAAFATYLGTYSM
jgi:hypothetical protein